MPSYVRLSGRCIQYPVVPLWYASITDVTYLDYNDRAAGVSLYYLNGDYYFSKWLYYGTILSIRCSDRTTLPSSADVQRYGLANYAIWLDSVYACPAGGS